MFVHPLNVSGLIQTELDPKQNQPNAIDVTCDNLYKVTPSKFFITNFQTQHRTILEEPTVISGQRDMFYLNVGVYQFESNVKVEIPPGYIGFCWTRSSLNRNGIIVTSGIYDSGFKGNIGGSIYNFLPETYIEKGCRICQFLVCSAENKHLYDGQYQGT